VLRDAEHVDEDCNIPNFKSISNGGSQNSNLATNKNF
jgi:hypothetical protein